MLENTYAEIDDWSRAIGRKFRGRMILKEKGKHVIEGVIAGVYYDVRADPNLSASEVIQATNSYGMRYSKEHRFFMIYDKKREFLFLLLYPHSSFCYPPIENFEQHQP